MIYKWMKEHKQQRKIVIFCGVIEICAWIILYFVWYFKGNNKLIQQNILQYICQFFRNIYAAITTILTLFGVPLVPLIKKIFQPIEKINKEKYMVIRKIRNTQDQNKLYWLSYIQLIIRLSGWLASDYIFYIVVVGMEQIFELKKKTSFIYLNLFVFGLALGAVIIFCMTYIITKSHLRSAITLMIYCFCTLLLLFGFFIQNSIELHMIIAFLCIGLSFVLLHMLHKINLVDQKGSLRLCITVTLRNITISASLFGIIFFPKSYMYNLAYLIYAITLGVDFMFEILKNENGLNVIYIKTKNEIKDVKTKGEIKKNWKYGKVYNNIWNR